MRVNDLHFAHVPLKAEQEEHILKLFVLHDHGRIDWLDYHAVPRKSLLSMKQEECEQHLRFRDVPTIVTVLKSKRRRIWTAEVDSRNHWWLLVCSLRFRMSSQLHPQIDFFVPSFREPAQAPSKLFVPRAG